ncbi:2-C-methyl-D-erythritol 2,4-cyclodiphosphate synthase [Candidatus Schneideria nysicola]|uniref:2-C-methyl-D-erythritol 2,4-cyclodiphosphate synthase n=1 Tax=Candidatus Schneideria nysicola TaxID=1081631 RepID=UPI001CAA8006|nr:2-C-methyl-D-erythritol 2,4-cyclodiphosphate synthase [Candidatus Schneideria nysicola]UAJ65311.1 2-C-methyl-D-erythritol 2,4-cyclodiphosphate synthase [Candidatus Schneideria nysicola]
MRIGHGFDVHKFSNSNKDVLVIGGVVIPFTRGIIAHSDGDVVIHALIDALLGAIALGDIGKFFPDTNPSLKKINSRILLYNTWKKIQEKGYKIGNIDMTVIAQKPQLSHYIQEMRLNISRDLSTHIDKISIKACTTEKLGFLGREEGIACEALVFLVTN